MKVLTLLVLLCSCAAAQQSAFWQEVFTQARGGARIDSGLETGFHQIAWVTSGNPGACHIALDYSNNGLTWHLGQVIDPEDCTHSGQTIIAGPQHVHYVRMRVATLASNGAVRATYTGYAADPTPGGTVTSVFGRTGVVQALAGDYDVSLITGAAPLFSPNFTGTPTGPTPPPTDNSGALATTEWVHQFLGSAVSSFSAGDLSPLFTTSVANPTSTPALSFHLSDAPPGTMLGNSGSTDAPPSWIPIPSGATTANSLLFGSQNFALGTTVPTAGQCLQVSGTSIVGGSCSGTPGGSGTVTSVGLTQTGSFFNITGSPVTTSGNVNLAFANAPANTMLANGTASSAAPTWIPIPSPGGGGVLGLTSDGTTLTFSGTGGIHASAFHSTATGPFQLTSITGSTPATPGAGNNGFVSGPDGWYVSNAGGAWTKIGAAPTGTLTGSGSSNVIPKFTTSTNVGNSLLSDDATSLHYSGTGGMTLNQDPPDSSDDQTVPTTAWVKKNAGGGGQPQAIPISRESSVCVNNPNANINQGVTLPNVVINAGDTVVVVGGSPNLSQTLSAASVTDNASPPNTYTQRHQGSGGGNGMMHRVFSTTPGTINPGTVSIVVSFTFSAASSSNTLYACAIVYKGVNAIGRQMPGRSEGNQTSPANNLTDVEPGGFIVGTMGMNQTITPRGSTRVIGQQANFLVCENSNATSTPATIGCAVTSSTGYLVAAGIELLPGVTAPTPSEWPRVVAFHKANISIGTSAVTDAAFMSCSATDCPPDGYYRISWDVLGRAVCTTGSSDINVSVDYTDESGARHTGMIGQPGFVLSTTPPNDHVFNIRNQTVASPGGIAITTTHTACTTGTGSAQVTVSIERLQ
jgi:hypothetical protein